MSLTVIFIVITVIASIYTWNNPTVYAKWIFNPYRIAQHKEYYRFLTSGFIHSGYLHLFINMLTFYFFARFLEYAFQAFHGTAGVIAFIALYLLGIIASDIPSFFKHKNDPGYNAVGASGGVSAIVFSSIMFNPVNDICLYFFICLPGFILGILFLIYSYYQGKNASDNIGHEAHFYGAVFGIIFTVIIIPEVLSLFWEHLSNWQPGFIK